MTRLLSLLLLAGIFSSGCQTSQHKIPVINLKALNKERTTSLEDRYNEYFSNYSAVFLENTESLQKKDISQAVPLDTLLFLLIKGQIKSYNYLSGKQNVAFAPATENNHFISFDISTDNTIYALDANQSRICSMNTAGNILDTIRLNPALMYDQLILVDSCTALLTTVTLPSPETFIVDLRKKNIQPKDLPGKSNFTPDNALRDSISQHLGPIIFHSRTLNGIIVKPLFKNTISRYTAQSSIPFARLKTKKELKYKPDIYQKAHEYTPCTGLWQLSDSTWLMRWQHQITTYQGENIIAKRFTILNPAMEIYNNTVYYNTALIQWEHPLNIYNLNAHHLIYIYPDKKLLFKIIRYDTKKILPPHLREYENKRNLILCYFHLK